MLEGGGPVKSSEEGSAETMAICEPWRRSTDAAAERTVDELKSAERSCARGVVKMNSLVGQEAAGMEATRGE